jgi:DNA (cytosine-5)-methyltransferase 1
MSFRVASFFAGAGGLDLGFRGAGFSIPWANEYDRTIWTTYERNHRRTELVRESLFDLNPDDLPEEIEGIIGGPPCQSWSEAGAQRGQNDRRGQLFFAYSDFVAAIRPKFFLAENVSGLLFTKHRNSLNQILEPLLSIGYNISFGLLNAHDYGVPQDRERVIIVGYRFGSEDLFFQPPPPVADRYRKYLKDALWDLEGKEKRAIDGYKANPGLRVLNAKGKSVANHEYLDRGGFSPIYMSRNRVRTWDQPSFTIQAGARHAPIHPQAPVMVKDRSTRDVFHFSPSVDRGVYRRITVREAARIQTFPDNFEFFYSNVADGYKMIGNAVPVEFARRLAKVIKADVELHGRRLGNARRTGRLVSFAELEHQVKS